MMKVARDAGVGRIGGLVGAVCTAAVLAGCSAPEGGQEAWRGSVVDSAGVAIVHNPATPPEQGPWALELELAISPDESRPETLFGHIADLAADDRGNVYVLDQFAQVIRVFDQDGTYVGPVGGPGEGPGEFSAFGQSVLRVGDTLLVTDMARRAVQRFGTDGEFISMSPYPQTAGRGMWWKRGGGALFFRGMLRVVREDGSWGAEDVLFRAAGDLASADTVMVFDYPQSDLGGRGNARVPYLVNAPTWTPLPDGGIAWTHLESERLFLHGPDGDLRRIVESPNWVRRAPTPAEGEVLRESMGERLRMLGGSPDALDNLPVVVPELLPAVTAVRSGPDGTLWVQRMGSVDDVHPMALNTPDPPSGWGGSAWDILDAEGRYLQTLELPERFRLLRFEGDWMYGVQRSELDEEIVMRFRVWGGD